jgi:hypothetical protein
LFESKLLKDLGADAKMDSPVQLQDFIKWGMSKFPAKHYLVVIMGHGGAWKGIEGINSKEIADAIKNGVTESNNETKRNDKIDALIFNSCIMGNFESVYQMKDIADISIVSEAIAHTTVFHRWDEIIGSTIKSLNRGESFEPRKFSIEMVDYYSKEVKNINENFPNHISNSKSTLYPTLSAIENKKLNEFVKSWKRFTDSYKKHEITDKQLFKIIGSSKNYSEKDIEESERRFCSSLKDIGDIMEKIIESDGFPIDFKESANEVLKSLNKAIIKEQHQGVNKGGSHGLTIWAPENYVDYSDYSSKYSVSVPDFLKETGWQEHLEKALCSNVPDKVKKDIDQIRSNIKLLEKQLEKPNITKEEKNHLREKLKSENKKLDDLRDSLFISVETENDYPVVKVPF